MLRNRFFTPAFALGLVALATATGQQTITLKYTPKVGDTAEYRVNGKVELMGMEVAMNGTEVTKVLKVEADRYVEQSTTTMTMSVQGQTQDIPSEITTTTYGMDGRVLELSGGEGSSYRNSHLGQFIRPATAIKVGDTWSFEAKGDPKRDYPAYKATYKYVGDEKVGEWDCAKFEVKYTETEGDPKTTSDGTQWFDKADGRYVKSEFKVKNLMAAGAPAPVDATMSAVRTK